MGCTVPPAPPIVDEMCTVCGWIVDDACCTRVLVSWIIFTTPALPPVALWIVLVVAGETRVDFNWMGPTEEEEDREETATEEGSTVTPGPEEMMLEA